MMVKSAQPGEDGGCSPFPFNSIYHHKQRCGVCYAPTERADHRVHTERQWPLSGAHSIMMVKSDQPGERVGLRPPHLTLSTITSKVVVYAPAERADTLLLYLLYPFLLCGVLYGLRSVHFRGPYLTMV